MGRGRGYSYDVHVPYQYLVIGRQKEVFFKKTSRWIYLGLDLPLKLGTGIFLDLNQNEMLDTGTTRMRMVRVCLTGIGILFNRYLIHEGVFKKRKKELHCLDRFRRFFHIMRIRH